MTRKVLKMGDPTLRNVCNPVTKFDMRLSLLLRDMAETMYKENGIGLAAPQIGITRRMAVVDVSEDGSGLMELINPEIIAKEGECEMVEGCLSVPNMRGLVRRPEKITVKAQNKKGESFQFDADGLLSRCIQHEIDHLNGVLYVDIMEYEVEEED